jgi:hypothetical protein
MEMAKAFLTTVSLSDAFRASFILFPIVFQYGVKGVEQGIDLMLGIQQSCEAILAIDVPCSMLTINGTWRNSEFGIDDIDGI